MNRIGIKAEHSSYFGVDGLYGGGDMDAQVLCEELVGILGLEWWVVEVRVCGVNCGGSLVVEGVVIEFWGEGDRDLYLECMGG